MGLEQREGGGFSCRQSRRSNAVAANATVRLHLTSDGRRLLDRLMQVSAEHEAQLCVGLTQAERQRLVSLLSRIAAGQGLPTGVHPGVATTNPDDTP